MRLGIPQRFAAASLKPRQSSRASVRLSLYSAAIRCGLIEAAAASVSSAPSAGIPQRFAAASLKLRLLAGDARAAMAVFRSDSLRPH